MKLRTLAHVVPLVFVAFPAAAQTSPPPTKVEKVEVTGSSIKRVQTEGALPLQVITREQINRAGIVSAEQLMSFISANGTGTDNLSSQTLIVGASDLERRNNNGNSSANLRGLGSSSTLVLLNGRRISTHGLKANSVDLNTIPLAAVERVEVLKDGASAIYGTDAIGGVINFILRKDYVGTEVTGFMDVTNDGGGNIYRGSVLAGFGTLAQDKYNVMMSLTVDKQQALKADKRDFSNGYQPDRGLSPDTTGSPFATQTGGAGTAMGATFVLPGSTQAYNRANLLGFQNNCESITGQSPYRSDLWGAANAPLRYGCSWDYAGPRSLIQPVDRVNLVGRGTFEISANHTAFAELVASRSDATKEFEQRQITTSIGAGTAYPVNGPYYQDLSAYIPTFNRNLPIAYRWRCMDCGPRVNDTETNAYRLLVGLEGVVFDKWDYKLGVSSSRSRSETFMEGGYFFTTPFNAILASGRLNPWLRPGQTQTQDVLDALAAASASGVKLVGGTTTLKQFDGAVSGELFKLPAGAVSVAAGFDYRKESYVFESDSTAQNPIADAPFDSNFNKVNRTIKAIYGELAIPVLKNLEVQLAVRRDDYSDFGTTTNPKVGVTFRPLEQLMLRGSWGEGFHAPGFVQLFSPQTEAIVAGNISDPVTCPANPGNPVFCSQRPNARSGGNADLKPETSRQWTAGFVVEPTDWFNTSVDLWEINRDDRVYSVTPQQVVANYQTFPDGIVRNPDGTINFIRAGYVNASGEITRGIDVGMRFRGAAMGGRWTLNMEGTYIDSYRTRIFDNVPYRELAGQWDSIVIFPRWKHVIAANYTSGPWSTTLTQRYTAHYKDEKPLGVIPPGFKEYVDAYIVHDIMVQYTGFKNLTLSGGIRNIANTDPPFSAHNVDFLSGAGWDPRVADPRGRAFVARATYSFR